MNKRLKNQVGIGIVAILIIYLGAQSFSKALSFYYEVGEFVKMSDSSMGRYPGSGNRLFCKRYFPGNTGRNEMPLKVRGRSGSRRP